MLIEPMIQQLQQLRLRGMAAALEQLLANAQHHNLSFEERMSLMIQHEITDRDSKRLAQRLRWAKLPQAAALEDLDTRTPRGLDPKLISMLTALSWIKDKLNVLITGPCGVGKSFIASALAHAACRADYSVRSYRLPRLVEELARHRAQANASAFLKQLAKVDLLYIDDFGLSPLADQSERDLLEILEDRYDKKSRLITSQLTLDQWHAYIDEPTLADAILDRLVHNSYRLTSRAARCENTNALPRPTLRPVDATATHPPQSHHPDSPGRHAPEQVAAITRNHRPTSAEYAVFGSSSCSTIPRVTLPLSPCSLSVCRTVNHASAKGWQLTGTDHARHERDKVALSSRLTPYRIATYLRCAIN